MLCYRPIQRLSDNRSINLNLSDHVRFSLEKMTLAVCTNRKNWACFICDHIKYKLQRYVARTMIATWSSSVLVKIFIIDGVAVGFTLNTATFRRRCFQANKALRKSEHLVLVTVYLKILNACKTIVMKIAILLYICTQTISIQIVFGHNLYDINQILICFFTISIDFQFVFTSNRVLSGALGWLF